MDVTDELEPLTETIGVRLRRLRTERGLSQRELSGPGVSYAYISRIEAGARRPSVKALRTLAQKLGVSAGYLETGSEIDSREVRELRLADAELQLRLGEPADVRDELEAILAESVTAGDGPSAARARTALGLAAAQRGDHKATVELLEQVVDDAAMSPSARPDVYTTLGRSYIALGQADRAVALWQRCLDEITDDAPEDLAAQVRFATYLSYALTDAGDLARAQTVLRDALRRSADLDDPYTRVRLYWSLGRLSGAEDHPLEALGYFRRAVALLEATEDTLHLARAHLACAVWVLNSNGDLDEAGSHLEIAERLFGTGAEASDRIMLRTEQAKLRVRLGNPGEAAELAREGLALAGESLPDERGRTWLVLAQAYALEGTSSAAEEAFGTATKLLEEHGTPQDRSELSRTWAKWLRSVGRDSEALDVLERAADSAAAER